MMANVQWRGQNAGVLEIDNENVSLLIAKDIPAKQVLMARTRNRCIPCASAPHCAESPHANTPNSSQGKHPCPSPHVSHTHPSSTPAWCRNGRNGRPQSSCCAFSPAGGRFGEIWRDHGIPRHSATSMKIITRNHLETHLPLLQPALRKMANQCDARVVFRQDRKEGKLLLPVQKLAAP